MSKKYSLAGSFIGLALVIAACSQGPSSRPSSPSSIFSSEESGGFAGMMNSTPTPTPSPTVDPCASLSSGDFRSLTPVACYTIAPVTEDEGNGQSHNVQLTAVRTGSTASSLSFTYSTSGGTATAGSACVVGSGVDYVTVTNKTVSMIPSQSSAPFFVTICGDTTPEPDETFNVVTDAGTTLVTIHNDDAVPQITVSGASKTEGNSGTSTMNFTVSLSKASAGTVTVQYATADGTATDADNDYEPTSGTVTFVPGDVSETVSVTINGDTFSEPTENFRLVLSNPSNAVFGGTPAPATISGTGSIVNDDNSQVRIRINPQTVVEGGQVLVTLLQSTNVPITFKVQTRAYTGANAATFGAAADYFSNAHYPTAPTLSVTIPAGTVAGTFAIPISTVEVRSDGVAGEPNEVFYVIISGATNAAIDGIPQALITIPAN